MQYWHAVYTKPRAEYRVSHALKERGIQVYLPEYASGSPRKLVREPLFPCYLFICADLEVLNPADWKWISGLRYIVAFGGEPAIVPAAAIQLIKQNVAKRNQLLQARQSNFQQDDTVRIVEGPFHDMVAIFDKQLDAKERVQVLLTMLGRNSRVKVDLQSIEKVDPAKLRKQHGKRPRRTRGGGRHIGSSSR